MASEFAPRSSSSSSSAWIFVLCFLVGFLLSMISTSHGGGGGEGEGVEGLLGRSRMEFYERIPGKVSSLLDRHGFGFFRSEESLMQEEEGSSKVGGEVVEVEVGKQIASVEVDGGDKGDEGNQYGEEEEEEENKKASGEETQNNNGNDNEYGEKSRGKREKEVDEDRDKDVVVAASVPRTEIDKTDGVRNFYNDVYSNYVCRKRKLVNGSKPAFLVVGVHKGGSTALFSYLAKHGRVRPSICKEINFFGSNSNYNKGMDFYLKHFYNVEEWNGQVVVGEGTPNYIRRPNVPYRVKKNLPNTKIIMALRNPMHRFVSHWVGLWSRKITDLPCDSFFNASLDLENRCMTKRGKWNESYYLQFMASKQHDSQAKQQLSETRNNLRRTCMKTLHEEALSRSIYHYQIEKWLAYFPEKQIKILQSEHLFNNAHDALQQTVKFIGIRPYNNEELSQLVNTAVGSHHLTDPLSLSCPLRKIGEYFSDDNRRLRNLLRERFPEVLKSWEPGWDGL